MGSCYSRLEREEIVTRCKARRRYMKELVQARHAFSATHSLYLRSLRGTGAALLQFANSETHLQQNHHHLQHHLPPPLPSPPAPLTPTRTPPLPSMSPSSETCTSVSASTCLPPPPPPPPPPSSWDFWDPFAPSSSRSVTEEEWEATTVSEVNVTAGAAVAAPPPVVSGYSKETTTTELAVVVSRNSKDLSEIIKDLDEYFLNAANAGSHVSLLLEVPSSGFSSQRPTNKVYSYGRNLSPLNWPWVSNSKSSGFGSSGRPGEERGGSNLNGGVVKTSHCSTIERLYAWEKKLYQEVRTAEGIKIEHQKRVTLLRKQEAKGADYIKIEKNKKEIEKLESRLMVASQAMESTSDEIIRLREAELYPQLLELAKGLMVMWRSMYECHQVQTHIVQQLKFLNDINSGTEATSEIHRQSTLHLELEVQQWHSAFCSLVKSQRDYILSLTGWLRLCLFQFSHQPLTKTQQNSAIYSLCEEWQLALDRIPDKVASEGIKSFLTVIHSVVLQQAEEQKLKKRSDALFKELDKKVAELRALENKYGPYSTSGSSTSNRSPVDVKKDKVEALRAKAEEEKIKYEKSSSVTRAMTLNNLQTGFPNVFQAMTGFASVCMQSFEAVFSQPNKNPERIHDAKRLLT
ncbi:protein ALTERED PHOSPHATE STARVATION RESPONSE 1-like [Aristolochia californica]|uniref:protein ALTERED PHOSPHATE STARVATION RESPONSE 1-like n=1 Tax=Aristolochia californica TaxID=171875 RepID=UPI0035E33CEB